MRLAYADPPYLGCAKLYPEHPHAAKWDDIQSHWNLMRELDEGYDGWAMSASAPSLQQILTGAPLYPRGLRVAVWVKPFAAYKANVRIAYTWEPVIFKPGRDSSTDGASVSRDHLSEAITLRKGLTGAKPERFCFWVLDLLGFVPGDEVVDLFPGTGVMSRVVDRRTNQGVLL